MSEPKSIGAPEEKPEHRLVPVCDSWAIVDASDFEVVSQYQWTLHSLGYAMARISGRTVLMHRLFLGEPKSHVDHINGNKLDNRRSNIRACTASENAFNRGKQKNNTSGFKGVSFSPCIKSKPWRASIGVRRKLVSLGYFATKEEASAAYEAAYAKVAGPFARKLERPQDHEPSKEEPV